MATSTRHHHKHLRHNNHDLYADFEKIKNAFAEAAIDAKDKAGDVIMQSVDGVKERSAKLQDNIVTYTSEKPFKSLGIALVAGIALGYLLLRRK